MAKERNKGFGAGVVSLKSYSTLVMEVECDLGFFRVLHFVR